MNRAQQVSANASILAVGKRFGRYKDEEKKKIRKIDVREDKVLEQLKQSFRKFNHEIDYDPERLLRDMTYTVSDVERFAIALAEFEDEDLFSPKAGNFLNALIDHGKGNDYTLFLRHLNKKIIMIGEKNRKNITIEGDVQYGVGIGMKKGEIRVCGSCGDNVGSDMEGGRIIIEEDVTWGCDGIASGMSGGEMMIKGNVKGSVGHGMTGGKITILGDVFLSNSTLFLPDRIGRKMDGGEIHILGDIIGEVDWDEVIHGKIYYRGKPMVDK